MNKSVVDEQCAIDAGAVDGCGLSPDAIQAMGVAEAESLASDVGRAAIGSVSIVGGAGHVGLPLALVLADSGLQVQIIDRNQEALRSIGEGRVPFMEHGAETLLRKVLGQNRLSMTADLTQLANAPLAIITIGTPVDEFLNPDFTCFRRWIESNLAYLTDDHILVLRSTVYPGTTDWLHSFLRSRGKRVGVAFCPERIVQGYALRELRQLPQIISATTPDALEAARHLFSAIAPCVVEMSPLEAEFAKLFANAYRYVQFAVANQFYMICDSAGVDYNRILKGMKKDYPRLAGLPSAGFAAGPCLFKDTMQLAAFAQNQFHLGHAAMLVNEGLVLYLVNRMRQQYDLVNMTVGLLGMAFKADNDDTRSSLSYKMKKALRVHCGTVLTTDPYVKDDPDLLPLDEVVQRSNLLVLCSPHRAYRGLDNQGRPVIDVWGICEQSTGALCPTPHVSRPGHPT
jgi:UDP-N-acetyl-D-mannosaminuronic acid dehydrogenase